MSFLFEPLTTPEFAELEQQLATHAEAGGMTLDRAHGLITAIASSARPIPFGDWLPLVVGGPQDDDPITLLVQLLRLHDQTLRELNQGQLSPLFLTRLDGEEEAPLPETWCDGYFQGMTLDQQGWEGCMEAIKEPIATLTAFSSQGGELLDADTRKVLDSPAGLRQAAVMTTRAAIAIHQRGR